MKWPGGLATNTSSGSLWTLGSKQSNVKVVSASSVVTPEPANELNQHISNTLNRMNMTLADLASSAARMASCCGNGDLPGGEGRSYTPCAWVTPSRRWEVVAVARHPLPGRRESSRRCPWTCVRSQARRSNQISNQRYLWICGRFHHWKRSGTWQPRRCHQGHRRPSRT